MLTIEAAALLAAVRAGLALLPFATVRRLLARWAPPRDARAPDAEALRRIRAAVERAGRHLPSTTCLVEALAADTMLRRRGYQSVVKFGVRDHAPGRRLNAHAWVECGDTIVVGHRVNVTGYAVFTEPR